MLKVLQKVSPKSAENPGNVKNAKVSGKIGGGISPLTPSSKKHVFSSIKKKVLKTREM